MRAGSKAARAATWTVEDDKPPAPLLGACTPFSGQRLLDQRVFVLEQAHLAHYIVEPTIRAKVDARMSGRVQKREARREQTMFAEGPISCAMMARAWPSCLSSLLRVE